MSSVQLTTADLPAEFDPSSLPISGKTAHCLSTVPIQAAFADLNSCYTSGADLQSCRDKTDYDTSYASFQACLAGPDTTATASAPVSNVTVASDTGSSTTLYKASSSPVSGNDTVSMTSDQTVSSSSSITKWVILVLMACNLVVSITILLLAFFFRSK